MLRAEDFGTSVAMFQAAWGANPNDHRAAYGAGIACESSGRYDDALKWYKRGLVGADRATYREARERMKEYGGRVRQ